MRKWKELLRRIWSRPAAPPRFPFRIPSRRRPGTSSYTIARRTWKILPYCSILVLRYVGPHPGICRMRRYVSEVLRMSQYAGTKYAYRGAAYRMALLLPGCVPYFCCRSAYPAWNGPGVGVGAWNVHTNSWAVLFSKQTQISLDAKRRRCDAMSAPQTDSVTASALLTGLNVISPCPISQYASLFACIFNGTVQI